MVPYFGDFPANATVYIPINTFDSNDPAASVTVTNLLNTDVHIHKDGGTTQRNNAAGITMSIDYDSITGNHLLTIDTSDTTVADFWQAGHEYQVRVEGITVDGGTINAWVGAFSIERSGGALALIKSATYGLSALKTLLDTTGIKVASFADNAITAASINADAITNAKIADNAIAAENLAADCITSAKIADNAFANEHFADGALTSTEITSAGGCVVASIANNAITAAAIATDAIDADALNADALAEIADAVWDEVVTTGAHDTATFAGAGLLAAASAGDPWSTALPGSYGAGTAGLLLGTTIPNAIDAIDNYVDTEIGALTTELAKVPKSDSNVSFNATAIAAIQNGLATPTNITAGTITTVTNLTNAPTNGDFTATMKSSITAAVPTAANNADAVWDEASTGHTDAGKAGAQLWTVLDDVPNTSEFQARTIAAADYTVVSDLGTVQTGDSFAIVNGDHGLVSIQDDIDAIKAKTDSLTFTVAGDVDCNVQTWKGSAAQDMTGDSYARLGAPEGASVSADIAAVKAETAAIVADTNELQTDDTPTAIAAVKTVVDLVEDILRNKMEITDANGNLVLYEDDGTTPKYSVNACVTDDATTTIRKRLE